MNPNTEAYWDIRFKSGDWEKAGGRQQTREFAKAVARYINIPGDFGGTIIDFGCGTGDAIPVYSKAFPNARLIGMDFSSAAIENCNLVYRDLAEFICGDFHEVPESDIIIASNVFEHLSDQMVVAEHLKSKCRTLFIIVPFKEDPDDSSEHINYYDRNSFLEIPNRKFKIFLTRGWSQYGFDLWYSTYFKNIFRFLTGRRILKRRRQIMFIFN